MDQVTGVFVGLATLDVVHHVTASPAANQKVTAQAQFVAAGGPAANAAVTFAGLGGRAILVTALGSEPAADLVRADLRACGVTVIDAALGRSIDVPVSAVTVTTSTGDRSVVSIDATTTDTEPPADFREIIECADVVLIDGHHPKLATAASNEAKALGIDVVLDAGRWKPVMKDLIPRAQVMICSNDFRVPGTSDSASTSRELVASGVATVVTTHGGDPVQWWQGGASGSVVVRKVRAIDTLGAGDVFHGAYCYFSRRLDLDLVAQLSHASRVAALKCSMMGPRGWLSQLADPQTWS